MAKIGLTNIWYSHLSEGSDGTPTYDGMISFGKAISASASIENNSAMLYADDVLAESDTSFQSGSITLGVDDDADEVFADVLGHTISESDEVVKSSDDTAPWVGLARVITKMVGGNYKYKAVVLYKVKFAEPSDEDQTKGESIEFATPEIEGTIATLANGNWAATKTFDTKAAAVEYIGSIFGAQSE